MKKQLVALAVAAAIAAPMTSAADVKIYGKMHYSWDWMDNGATGADDSDDATGVNRASRLGFKGSEDLGDGLKAIWQIEGQINNAFDARNTFVGLSGGFGTIVAGRHDTPYKMATGSLDIFADTAADYNNIISRTAANANAFDLRVPQTVAYITPDFSGFTAAIARVSTLNNEANGLGNDELQAWSAMGMYKSGPLMASLAWEQHGGGLGASSATNEADAWKLGLGYTFGNSKVGFVYENMDNDAAASVAERNAWLVNFAHKFGANTLKASYGTMDDSAVAGSNDSVDNWSIGVDHAFSKRTSVYALYTTVDNDKTGVVTTNNGGPGIAPAGAVAGKDYDVFSVGMVHKF